MQLIKVVFGSKQEVSGVATQLELESGGLYLKDVDGKSIFVRREDISELVEKLAYLKECWTPLWDADILVRTNMLKWI